MQSADLNSSRNSGCHGFGVFDKAVSSWFDNVSEEHGFTEDGKTVAPIFYGKFGLVFVFVPEGLQQLAGG